MDTSHHKFTWEPYTTLSSTMEALQEDPPFDPSQWPYYLPTPHPHPLDTSTSSPAHLLPPPPFLPDDDNDDEELGAMKEMMFKIAAMQPVDIDPATIRRPRRRNVRISDDPQSVAARHRRERISEKIRILQRLVPGGTKMDTASMLDEAIRYVKFLKRQIRTLQGNSHHQPPLPNAADDWNKGGAAAGSSYLFSNDGAAGDDFNHKFIPP